MCLAKVRNAAKVANWWHRSSTALRFEEKEE
jgi:hypothetical protein